MGSPVRRIMKRNNFPGADRVGEDRAAKLIGEQVKIMDDNTMMEGCKDNLGAHEYYLL